MHVDDVLTADAVSFLTDLEREFGDRRRELLARRAERLRRLTGGGLAAGELPDFLPETEPVREDDWRIARFPDEIADRRVEITGPVDRKMVINALNLSMFELASGYRDDAMTAYVELQEREFSLEGAGYTATRHQREVGAGYFDQVMQAVSGGVSSTLALTGSTEEQQFHAERSAA